ncbi:hypothetical protein Ctha_0259 [Chloroherpeton thalassium ATCC 35110]|uniref:Uncharacterized protein n=1 Tax=Chloroherpeton thalassium (strain ATCC 35110 / GB-78) TaxID=517418 RepID=B3QTI4_CHLT3|nr:hypothetical protein [Chloroherpeton thalassium]ACF12730.1 hypothetical protein Ctha_0259 [Chloroherpeton thalassium ATCC 35110]
MKYVLFENDDSAQAFVDEMNALMVAEDADYLKKHSNGYSCIELPIDESNTNRLVSIFDEHATYVSETATIHDDVPAGFASK